MWCSKRSDKPRQVLKLAMDKFGGKEFNALRNQVWNDIYIAISATREMETKILAKALTDIIMKAVDDFWWYRITAMYL